jgi:hypothetical protein
MGSLTYGSEVTATFEDRTLMHLQVVIWSKLRRGEHFAFTWNEESPSAMRTSVWCGPTIPMSFRYEVAENGDLNPRWLDLLTKSANSAGGLKPIPEPEDAA